MWTTDHQCIGWTSHFIAHFINAEYSAWNSCGRPVLCKHIFLVAWWILAYPDPCWFGVSITLEICFPEIIFVPSLTSGIIGVRHFHLTFCQWSEVTEFRCLKIYILGHHFILLSIQYLVKFTTNIISVMVLLIRLIEGIFRINYLIWLKFDLVFCDILVCVLCLCMYLVIYLFIYVSVFVCFHEWQHKGQGPWSLHVGILGE